MTHIRSTLCAVTFSSLCALSLLGARSAQAQNATMLRVGALPSWIDRQNPIWYYAPDVGEDYYPNVVDVNGRVFSIMLVARERNTRYIADDIAVYDVTTSDIHGVRWNLGENGTANVDGVRIEISYDGSGDKWAVYVSFNGTNAFRAWVHSLYAWRYDSGTVLQECGTEFYVATGLIVGPPSDGSALGSLIFDKAINWDANDVDLELLKPRYAVRTTRKDGTLVGRWTRIGDLDCGLQYDPRQDLIYWTRRPGSN